MKIRWLIQKRQLYVSRIKINGQVLSADHISIIRHGQDNTSNPSFPTSKRITYVDVNPVFF